MSSNSEPVKYGRKKTVPACPNPLFLMWLTELRDAAAENKTKMQYVYQKAISSLKKYPLPLKNGKEAKILQNFGDGICKILDDKLAQYYAENGQDAPIHTVSVDNLTVGQEKCKKTKNPAMATAPTDEALVMLSSNSPEEDGPSPSKKKVLCKSRKGRPYVPQKRSGGYAVLLALYQDFQKVGSKGFLTKAELQREAQPLCDKSFTVPELGTRYTAWSSVSTLIQKDFVLKTNNPARYSLTKNGLELARKLLMNEENTSNVKILESSQKNGSEQMETVDLAEEEETDEMNIMSRALKGEGTEYGQSSDLRETSNLCTTQDGIPALQTLNVPHVHVPEFTLKPGCFDIILCVDFIETTGGSSARKQELVTELKRNGVNFDVRKLHVGDFLWVAREKVNFVPGQLRAPQPRELVLDYIVERKRMDDLCGSIIDGRFREQKFRLKRCGLKKPIYLVEDCGSAQHLSLPESTLQQAIVNTQVVDNFFIKQTKDVRESAAYLTIMTRYLQSLYMNKTLMSCFKEELKYEQIFPPSSQSCIFMTFMEFNEGAMKNKAQTVKEVFARQLMQISGISGDKAVAILNNYSTPSRLLEAYKECATEQAQEKLLSGIKYGKLQRNIGPALSKTISQLYCTMGPLS
ncbi:crossover junction endonuclease MUS81 [Polypterus senegalus]|uniref:crossover junction endonuclease MUS81 n=1 Tax=Polypterus senegalus TaxID=55291 RepID=UPI001966054F|nr:crossover junction endonuclease MUS81 [Polypterus senegalus]XP_039625053.1 crossover junction endonuclease MUS81 [Polypterus senegalus]XP_039625054.1 crossover junction endonuclease MUS81 [Polypterus senegalus]XP_039625055.1 crossover junction endonuclease MUS81 [Polypterus senegalus]